MRLRKLDLTCLRSLVDLEDANVVHALDLRAAYAREVVLEKERTGEEMMDERSSEEYEVLLNAQKARALACSASGQNV